MWKKKSSEYVFENRWLKVRRDDLDVNGEIYDYYFVELEDDVVVASLTIDKEILFVKPYRVAVEKMMLELPAGFVDKGSTPKKSASKELAEETGYKANKIKKFGEVYRSPSKLTHKTNLYLATDLEWVGQEL